MIHIWHTLGCDLFNKTITLWIIWLFCKGKVESICGCDDRLVPGMAGSKGSKLGRIVGRSVGIARGILSHAYSLLSHELNKIKYTSSPIATPHPTAWYMKPIMCLIDARISMRLPGLWLAILNHYDRFGLCFFISRVPTVSPFFLSGTVSFSEEEWIKYREIHDCQNHTGVSSCTLFNCCLINQDQMKESEIKI